MDWVVVAGLVGLLVAYYRLRTWVDAASEAYQRLHQALHEPEGPLQHGMWGSVGGPRRHADPTLEAARQEARRRQNVHVAVLAFALLLGILTPVGLSLVQR